MYENLFEPMKIGKMEIKNRLVVPAMSTLTATDEGACTEQFVKYIERKAQGGWGLIITEYYGVAPNVGFFPRMLGIWNEELIENHKQVTKAAHDAGAKIAAQISHSGRETFIGVSDENLVAPSPIKDVSGSKKPRELTKDEINQIVSQYGDTALNLKKAGFDAVEIYAAHGYLISNFLSKYSNKRIDEYGGCLENRMRFLLEIVADTRKKVGPDFPILVRISTREFVPGGLSIAESRVIAKKLEEASVDAIDCSQGIFTVSNNIVEPMQMENGVFLQTSKEIKECVNIPVISAGRINEASIASSALATGKCDFVGMGRASLADPDFPKKVQSGHLEEIRYCIGCVQGCIGGNMRGENCHCLVNPELNREYELPFNPVNKSKNIAIAGAGIAGLQAAITAKKRGHNVVVYEKESRPGGTWNIAALPPYKGELMTFVKWLVDECQRLKIEIKYNQEFQVEDAKDYDEVIIATGCKPFMPGISGCNQKNVVQANDILLQNVNFGKNVVVIGGGSVGVETAEYLAFCGCNVTIIEMQDDILIGLERETSLMLKDAVRKYQMKVLTNATVNKIDKDKVFISRKGKEIILDEIDTVVVAAGSKSVNHLVAPLQEMGTNITVIGDAKKVRNGLAAVYEGYMAGYNI
ncbi:MAG: FAD-dependent oxidoreductase [Thomasclavelia sp.]